MSRAGNKSAGKSRKESSLPLPSQRGRKSPAQGNKFSMSDLFANIDNISDDEKKQQYETYEKTGDFGQDFVYLSLLSGIKLSIGNRLKLPANCNSSENESEGKSPSSTPSHEKIKLNSSVSQDGGRSVHNNNAATTTTDVINTLAYEKQMEMIENDCPQTYVVAKDRYTYFKPRLQIETEFDQKEHVKALYLRGWKADQRVIAVLSKTLPELEKLTTLNMWNAGLDNDTLSSLGDCLSSVPSLKTLCLDGNSFATSQHFHIFLQQPSKLNLQHLSLRHCKINNIGAAGISQALSSNTSLLTLNLCFNHLGDEGVRLLSQALSFNRTLLSLNIGSNGVGDAGVEYMSKALTRFPLTEDQVFARRRKLSSLHELAMDNDVGSSTPSEKPNTLTTPQGKRGDNKAAKKAKEQPSSSKARSNSRSKANWGKMKAVAAATTKVLAKTEEEEVDVEETRPVSDPLLEKGVLVNGQLFLPGNRVVINLNLSRNKITRMGLELLYSTLKYQEEELAVVGELKTNAGHSSGLKKLSLQHNCFAEDDERYVDILNLIKTRDPLVKKNGLTTADENDKENISC